MAGVVALFAPLAAYRCTECTYIISFKYNILLFYKDYQNVAKWGTECGDAQNIFENMKIAPIAFLISLRDK